MCLLIASVWFDVRVELSNNFKYTAGYLKPTGCVSDGRVIVNHKILPTEPWIDIKYSRRKYFEFRVSSFNKQG
jgi:hypothetical protein